MKKAKEKKGFTLIELIVVIVIIAILVVAAMPELKSTIFGSKRTSCESDLKVMGDATMKYYTEVGTLPPASNITELREILTNKQMINGQDYGPWMKKNMKTTDPWNNEYQIEFSSGGDFDIYSEGPTDTDTKQELRYSTLGNRK